jgi:hypothetical protein
VIASATNGQTLEDQLSWTLGLRIGGGGKSLALALGGRLHAPGLGLGLRIKA